MKGKVQSTSKVKQLTKIILAVIMIVSVFVCSGAYNLISNAAYISLAPSGYKIGGLWTYRKGSSSSNLSRDLNVFCAQEGAHLSSHSSYKSDAYDWDEVDASFWKSGDSLKKIKWIRDNFWEEIGASEGNKYTSAQKAKILGISEDIVNSVFNDNGKIFKLYQVISWTYTNGNTVNPSSILDSNTLAVYNAIISLANNNYQNNVSAKVNISQKAEPRLSGDNFIWELTIENTCLYQPEASKIGELYVDGNKVGLEGRVSRNGNNYTITIPTSEVKQGISDHIFTFNASPSYQVKSGGYAYTNKYNQNMIEVFGTKRTKYTDSITNNWKADRTGDYSLKIEKTNADNESEKLTGVSFVLKKENETIKEDYMTDDNGVAIITKKDGTDKFTITGEQAKNKEKDVYTITEVDEDGSLVQLINPVKIEIRYGMLHKDGDVYPCVREVVFDNGENEMEAILKNGKYVKLKIETNQEAPTVIDGTTKNVTTTIKLTIPNKHKQADLALTKSIIISDLESANFIDRYDINRDGKVSALDASNIFTVYRHYNIPVATIKQNVQECANMTDDEIISKLNISVYKDNGTETDKAERIDMCDVEYYEETFNSKLLKRVKEVYGGQTATPDDIAKYDFNGDGKLTFADGSFATTIFNKLKKVECSADGIRTVLNEYYSDNSEVISYYEDLSDEALLKKFNIIDNETLTLEKMDHKYVFNAYKDIYKTGEVDRINYVDPSIINTKDITTAEYNMDKRTVDVKKDDIITYKITVYNEGDYDSANIKINDYLPEGLAVCDDEGNIVTSGEVTINHNNESFTWNIDGKTASTTIFEDTINWDNNAYIVPEHKQERIKALKTVSNGNEFLRNELDYYDVYIKCKVENSVDSGTVLYNVAEIADANFIYLYNGKEQGRKKSISSLYKDRDSDEGSIPAGTATEDYKKVMEVNPGIDTNGNNDISQVDKSIYNFQDDDDFERVKVIDKGLDLSLRKSITKVGVEENQMKSVTYVATDENGNNVTKTRLPALTEYSSGICKLNGTGEYYHKKEEVNVNAGDFVEYTIRVYNEGGNGDYSGYAKQITDYLPAGLEFYGIVNKNGGWITTQANGKYVTETNNYGHYEATYDKTQNKVVIDSIGTKELNTTDYLSEIKNLADDGTRGYYTNSESEESEKVYAYQEVKLICKVTNDNETGTNLTNMAEITNSVAVENGQIVDGVTDRDSTAGNIQITSGESNLEAKEVNLNTYYKDREINDAFIQYYPGLEDDDDFETVIVKKEIIEGSFGLNLIKYIKGTTTPLSGAGFKISIKDETGKELIQDTSKVYTTGNDGKLTEEIQNLAIEAENKKYTVTVTEVIVPTGYEGLKGPITFKATSVKSGDKYILKAEELTDIENSKKVTILQSNILIEAENTPKGEFDLSLRKFITGVTTGDGKKTDVTSRIPVFKIDENGNYVYNHDKEPVTVANQNVVEYTIRVYNEGTKDGYAKEIKDDIPQGLEFLPDDNLNKEYRWMMLDEEGNETDDVSKAKYITTDYLSKEQETTEGENLLKAFDEKAYESGAIKEPDYKEVKVAFKVTMPNTSDKIIINQAQISKHSDKDGNDVTDKDSTPNKWIEGDDDQDIEKIKVQYFDLSLRKWVTKAIVIEDGKETVSQTGHKAEDDPEAVVKVDLKKSKLNKVVVKFEYQIRITNEGEIAGYAKEISDYIPEGLKFEAADNPTWREEEGKVVTDELKDTLLQPGESKEVTIRLTWINREDNMGLKVNVAEISKDYNEYGTPDIDSTPNNKVSGEDDIDDAPVMLTVTTGQTVMYIGIVIGVLAILAIGTIGIRKYVLK